MNPRNPITRIQRKAGIPLHIEAEQRIRRLIAEPTYREGAFLPNEIGLAEKLGISRHTLRASIGRLVNEGLLVRTAGLGTRVCSQPVRTDVNAWSSFTREMARLGFEVENFEVKSEFEPTPAEVARRLGIEPNTPTLRLFRVRGWGGKRAVVSDSWLHPRLGLTGEEDFSRPLYEIIQAAGNFRPRRSVEEISVIRADLSLAEKLKMDAGAPLLLRRRLVFDSENQPIEFNINSYLPECYSLHLDLEASSGT